MTYDEEIGPNISCRAVLDELVRAIVVTDPSGRIVLWSRAAERLYGWAEHEVLGQSVIDVLAPAHHVVEDSHDLELVAGGRAMSGDRLVKGRHGESLRVHTSTARMLDRDGNTVAIVGAAEDVGELRAAEQRAQHVSDQFQLALMAGGLGTWRWDIASGETIWDERLEALFGLDAGGFDGSFESYTSMLHPEDRESVVDGITEAVSSKSTYRVEHRVVWPDGSVHWLVGAGGVTLDHRGEVTGTVGCVLDVTERVQQELERQRLSDLAVIAADNERLQRERLEFLAQINEALSASSTIHEVMSNVAKRAVPRLGDWCTIHVLPRGDRRSPEVEVAHVDPAMVAYARELQERFPYDPDAPGGVAAVIRTGVSEFYPEISDDLLNSLELADEARELVLRLDLGSAVTVAIKRKGRVLGAIQFVATTRSRQYTSDDVALAETLAGRIGSSIENLRLQEEQREIAHTLQLSLLPISLPAIPGIDAAVRYWPNGEATEVGGDFYDVFALDDETHDESRVDGRVAIVLGDVCGTGPAAAALTGLARHTIRDSAWHGDDHEAVLGSLNRAVRRSGTETFLTCIYATVQSTDAAIEVTLACGGHPLPVLVSGSAATTIGVPGTLLGVFDHVAVPPATVRLSPGDVLVFHTDGVTDAHPPYSLSDTQWTELVAEAAQRGGTAEDIADRISESIEAILPFASRNDDIALLVLAADQPVPDQDDAIRTRNTHVGSDICKHGKS